MRDKQESEQSKWALWAAALIAAGLLAWGYGCGATDPRASGDDGAAHPGEERAPDSDARTEATDMDAHHSAAWMEALDGLVLVQLGDGGLGAPVLEVVEGAQVTPAAPAPTVYVAPPSYATLDTSVQLTEARFESLLAQAGFDLYTWPAAKAVAWCESKWSPNATGAAGERGTFQVHPIHHDSTYDELGNFLAAYRISSGGYDWSAWSCRP